MSTDTTEIREPNFAIDLPGDWEQMPGEEEGALVFAELKSDRGLTVLLLAVRPLFVIADQRRLLEDYMGHRSRFEEGKQPRLSQTTPEVGEGSDALVGTWSAVDLETVRRYKHRAVLDRNLLVDFRYEAGGLEEAEFAKEADSVLATAHATAG